jgi:hypothetical protein
MSGSWNEPRRIIMKAEHSEKGTNHRFLVTNLSETATWVYSKFYVQRAEDSENRIKELKLDIKSDRLSCHKFIANQFRLFLHQAAYWLMQKLKQLCLDTQFAKARIVTLREKILKLAVRVRHSARRVFVQFASSCPIQNCSVNCFVKLKSQDKFTSLNYNISICGQILMSTWYPCPNSNTIGKKLKKISNIRAFLTILPNKSEFSRFAGI